MDNSPLSYESAHPTAGSFAYVATKLLGIYCVLQSLPIVDVVIFFITKRTAANILEWFPYGLLAPILHLAIGIFLMLKTAWVVQRILPKAHDYEGFPDASATEIMPMSLATVGVLLIGWTLPEIVSAVVFHKLMASNGAGPISQSPDFWKFLVRLAIGCILFFRSHLVIKLWNTFRRQDLIAEPPLL